MHALRIITRAAPLSLQGRDRRLQWRLVLRSPRRIRRHTVNLALIGVKSICGASEGRGTRRQVLLTAGTGGGDPQLFQFARKAPVSPSSAPTTARHAVKDPGAKRLFLYSSIRTKLAFWSPQEAEGRRPARLLARFGACLYPEPPTPNNQPSPRPGGCYSRLIGDTNQTGRGVAAERKVFSLPTPCGA